MAFSWKKLREVAKHLHGQPNNKEERLRTAVNRYYYTAFHACREYLEAINKCKFKPRGVHQAVLDGIMKVYPELGEFFEELLNYRKLVDYKDVFPQNEPPLPEMADKSLKLCDEILRKIQTLRTNP